MKKGGTKKQQYRKSKAVFMFQKMRFSKIDTGKGYHNYRIYLLYKSTSSPVTCWMRMMWVVRFAIPIQSHL